MIRGLLTLKRCLFLISIAVALFPACATTHAASHDEKALCWRVLFPGIDYVHINTKIPLPQEVHAVRIDLRDERVSFLATPSNGPEEGETHSRTPSTFLKEFGCQVAINASPFGPVVKEEGLPQDVVGISVSNGDQYSEPSPGNDALYLTRDGKAWCRNQADPPADVWNAVGGFNMLLKNGENVGAEGERHPRTAAGVTPDGRWLVLMALDGRQPGYSEGATLKETAEWMSLLGCQDAVNLDGGGSTSMVIQGENGEPKILNRPIQGGVPGTERPSANHLGVFVKDPAKASDGTKH